ncbi:MAG TPA: nucleotidyltransferase family protein [Acidimicrobiia bacterium]
MTVAAALLAAGRGSRLGADATAKPLLELSGRRLVDWALDAAITAGTRPVLLVVGHGRDAVAAAAPPTVQVITATDWGLGIAHSLRAALDALEPHPEIDAVCVGLADQPRVGPDAYRRLVDAHQHGATLAVATYTGQRANPVLLDRSLWPEARTLHGDTGARALMSTHTITEVDCTGTGDPTDVDTLDDLRALEGRTE